MAMGSTRQLLFGLAAVLSTAIAAAAASAQSPAAATPPKRLAVTVHPRNPARSLSLEEVADLFLARRQFWGLSVRVTLVLQQAGSPAHAILLRRVLAMTDAELQRLYRERRYRGTLAVRIHLVASDQEARAVVAATPAAIGYVLESSVDASVRVVLRVDAGEAAP